MEHLKDELSQRGAKQASFLGNTNGLYKGLGQEVEQGLRKGEGTRQVQLDPPQWVGPAGRMWGLVLH